MNAALTKLGEVANGAHQQMLIFTWGRTLGMSDGILVCFHCAHPVLAALYAGKHDTGAAPILPTPPVTPGRSVPPFEVPSTPVLWITSEAE